MLIGVDISRALRAQRTGTERYTLEIVQHLLTLPAAAAHQWRLYTDVAPTSGLLPARAGGGSHENVTLCVLPAPRLWTHRRLGAEVTTRPPDVLFVPAHVLPLRSRWRLPPSVVTIHDLGYRHFPKAHTLAQRLYLEVSTRWSASAATRLIAVSRATAEDLARSYATPPEKIRVVYEAAPPPTPVTPVSNTATRQRLGLDRPYVLFVGTLQPRKNVVRMAQAFAALVGRQGIDGDLLLAGAPGWKSEPVLAALAGLGLGDRLRRLGYVADDDLPALYTGARLFCFVSLYEGFGLPVLEAQSYGVPVMTANNSSLPEIAGDAALLVDPTDVDAIADAMLRLSQDEALRQRLIAAGYENVKRFSWEKAAAETLAVLEQAARTKAADETK